MSTKAVLDGYFIENRAKLLDLAAFMDRFERAGGPRNQSDHRWQAIIAGLAVLSDGQPERARRMLELWSDPSSDPIPKASVKGATGAWMKPE